MSEQKKVALVTGRSTGIGYEISLALACNGFHTYATMRKVKDFDILKTVALDEKLLLDVLYLDLNDDSSIIYMHK